MNTLIAKSTFVISLVEFGYHWDAKPENYNYSNITLVVRALCTIERATEANALYIVSKITTLKEQRRSWNILYSKLDQ